MGIDRPILCGVSMGGMIAQVYASRDPDQSAPSCSPTRSPQRSQPARPHRAIYTDECHGETHSLRGLQPCEGARTVARTQTRAGSDNEPPYGRLPGDEYRRRCDRHQGGCRLPHHRHRPVRNHRPDTQSVWRTRNLDNQPPAPTLSAQIANSTVQEVPDAGHASPWDNPELFNSTIRTFLTNQTPIEAD